VDKVPIYVVQSKQLSSMAFSGASMKIAEHAKNHPSFDVVAPLLR
jgi:hypothetical protein